MGGGGIPVARSDFLDVYCASTDFSQSQEFLSNPSVPWFDFLTSHTSGVLTMADFTAIFSQITNIWKGVI